MSSFGKGELDEIASLLQLFILGKREREREKQRVRRKERERKGALAGGN